MRFVCGMNERNRKGRGLTTSPFSSTWSNFRFGLGIKSFSSTEKLSPGTCQARDGKNVILRSLFETSTVKYPPPKKPFHSLIPVNFMEPVYCGCDKEAKIMTSRTSRNPGRRFYACPVKDSQCNGFIGWVNDKPEDMLPGLLRALNVLEDSNAKLLSSNDEFQAKLKETQAELKK